MPHKKLFTSLGAGLLSLSALLFLWFLGYFSPTLPQPIAQEVAIGTLKGVPKSRSLEPLTHEDNAEQSALPSMPLSNQPLEPLNSAPIQLTSLEATAEQGISNQQEPTAQSALEKNWIQVGSFTDPNNLNRVLEELKAHGLNPSTEATNINGKSAQRVFIGPFQQASQLEAQLKALEPLGYQGYAVQRSNQSNASQ
ncbi:MAG: SPOR domain-containing protein [Cardiobacteriaceae bacterium]|nr:SPOR domain-containing protein [Cardiobacteriaceae bacterium]